MMPGHPVPPGPWPTQLFMRGLEAMGEAVKLETGPATPFAMANRVALELKTFRLRDYGRQGDGLPILVHAPFAGHDAARADRAADGAGRPRRPVHVASHGR